MVDAQTVSLIFGGIGVGVAAVYYIITLHNNNVNRQAQLLTSIYKDFAGEWIINNYFETLSYQFKDYQDFNSKYSSVANRDAFVKICSILNFFDEVGVLLKQGLIDESLVFDMMGGSVMYQWYKYRVVVEGMVAEGWNNPSFWSGLRYIAGRMEKLMAEKDVGWKPRFRSASQGVP
jgi:hypothetical protein